jgi:nitrate/TMAO reductase-like tetraheme cytochrome c subunit
MQVSTDLIPSHSRNSKGCLGSGLLSFFVWASGFILFGILLVSLTNTAVVWTSSDKFCGQFCHPVIWANTAYQKSPHYRNRRRRILSKRIVPQIDGSKLLLLAIPVGSRRG